MTSPPTPSPPEGWEPAVGDVLAVRTCVLSAIPEHDDYDVGLQRTRSRHELAPWLPAEDHAALLRLRDASRLPHVALGRAPSEFANENEWVAIPRKDFDALRAALAATEHIR